MILVGLVSQGPEDGVSVRVVVPVTGYPRCVVRNLDLEIVRTTDLHLGRVPFGSKFCRSKGCLLEEISQTRTKINRNVDSGI